MSKRNHNFKRRKQDAYDTPKPAVVPLIPFLPKESFSYWEPCAGKGDLVNAIFELTPHCAAVWKTDIEPRAEGIFKMDAITAAPSASLIITNPPWTRELLHPMIENFRKIAPAWLLFDADWMHNIHAEPYLKYCSKIVSVGRVSWMQNGTSGLDNVVWYLFEKELAETTFYGRVKNK